MLANLAQSSQSSILPASIGPVPRSRIRCKMCRQVLATREDMLDHGQLRPAIVPKAESPAAETLSPILNSDKTDQATQDASETIVTSSSDAASEGSNTTVTTPPGTVASPGVTNAPILLNPKCSGYFVEPLKWMEPFLESGDVAGKIICPNKRCGAKLGNYDWAGVSCGCREWVTPGFCINRSKVDEVV